VLAWRVLQADQPQGPDDVVIATWLALLDQPEFRDAERVRELLAAVETREALLRVVQRVIGAEGGVTVALGDELGEPELRRLALVVAPYGGGGVAGGALGVIGPWRMDYARAISLVGYL